MKLPKTAVCVIVIAGLAVAGVVAKQRTSMFGKEPTDEQKARDAAFRYCDAMVKRDPEAALKVVDVPWLSERNAKSGEQEPWIHIKERHELDPIIIRCTLNAPHFEKDSVSVKITGARRWAHMQHAIPWGDKEGTNEVRALLLEVAGESGWLVQAEFEVKDAGRGASQLLVVVQNGEAKVRGGWLRGDANVGKLLAQ